MTKCTRLTTAGFVMLVATLSGSAQAQRGRGRGQERRNEGGTVVVVSPDEQRHRVEEEREREQRYRTSLEEQNRLLRTQAAQLQAERREAAYRAQQEYAARLAEQQRELQVERAYDRDPYIAAPHVYRYVIAGAPRETNQYGVNVLRQAVSYGYQQGLLAGRADRRDNWRPDYRNSLEYRDANYGYTGRYVDQADYNYYFREGFRRGYEDGYDSRNQYGTYSNGSSSILSTVLNGILGLVPLR